MIPITIPGPSALNPDSVGMNLLQQRRDEQQREVSVDDRRHARQHLEQGLDDPAQPRSARTRSGRWPPAGRPGAPRPSQCRHQRGAGDKRQHAEMFLRKERRPLRAGEKLDNRHLTQEGDRLEQQHRDDAAGDQNGHRGAHKQHALDDELDDATLPVVHFA